MESRNRVFDGLTLSSDEFIGKVQTAFLKLFDKCNFEFVDGNMAARTFRCRVRTKLFNPIVSLRGILRVKCDGDSCAANIEYDTRTNGWFWFTFLIGFLFWPIWVLMIWMWFSQKKKTVEAIETTLRSLDFDLR